MGAKSYPDSNATSRHSRPWSVHVGVGCRSQWRTLRKRVGGDENGRREVVAVEGWGGGIVDLIDDRYLLTDMAINLLVSTRLF